MFLPKIVTKGTTVTITGSGFNNTIRNRMRIINSNISIESKTRLSSTKMTFVVGDNGFDNNKSGTFEIRNITVTYAAGLEISNTLGQKLKP